MRGPGKRIDESMPGYGFGLPITRELAELRSRLGGRPVQVRINTRHLISGPNT